MSDKHCVHCVPFLFFFSKEIFLQVFYASLLLISSVRPWHTPVQMSKPTTWDTYNGPFCFPQAVLWFIKIVSTSYLLRYIPVSLRSHQYIVEMLHMFGWKDLMTIGVGDEPPSIPLWKSLMLDYISLERLRFHINVQNDLFKGNVQKSVELPGKIECDCLKW